MIIFDENNKPTIIDNIYGPVVTEYVWVFDLPSRDYQLAPITMLEETRCATMRVLVRGSEFAVPVNWNILICDVETTQVDIVPIGEVAGREFSALVYGPTKARAEPCLITITDYQLEGVHVSPTLGKNQMLCHAIGPNEWVTVGASDGYNKYLKNATIGDLVS